MKGQTVLMMCYQVLDDTISFPNLSLSEAEVETLEAAKVIMAKQYMYNANADVKFGDGENILDVFDDEVMKRMEVYHIAAEQSMGFKPKPSTDRLLNGIQQLGEEQTHTPTYKERLLKIFKGKGFQM